MKKTILVVLIYLVGCVCGYKYTKFNLMNNNYHKVWTKGDRTFSILLSSVSMIVDTEENCTCYKQNGRCLIHFPPDGYILTDVDRRTKQPNCC